MEHFPQFMKNPANAIKSGYQSKGVEGYVFDGSDGSQMAFWECLTNGESSEHVHDFDEYFIVVQGRYTLVIEGNRIPVSAGEEFFIP